MVGTYLSSNESIFPSSSSPLMMQSMLVLLLMPSRNLYWIHSKSLAFVPVLDQKQIGGRMIIPVGPNGGHQELLQVEYDIFSFIHKKLRLIKLDPKRTIFKSNHWWAFNMFLWSSPEFKFGLNLSNNTALRFSIDDHARNIYFHSLSGGSRQQHSHRQ